MPKHTPAHAPTHAPLKSILLALGGLCVVALAGVLVYSALAPVHTPISPRDPNAALGQLDGKSPEEIQAELNRVVEEGMFNISIAPVVYFTTAQAEGSVRIENVPGNNYDMAVSIALDDTGEVVYTTGVLEPNHHIANARLERALEVGTHEATATFTALAPGTDEVVGQASAKITLIVES